MTTREASITLADYEAFLDAHPDGLYELIDGEIVEKVVTEEHANIAGIIIGELYIYFKRNPDLKAHMGPETRYRPTDTDLNDRQPDVSVRLTDQPAVKQGSVEGMPDLAVEIKSPTNKTRHLREKARFYLANGCRMVWIVYPAQALVEVYHADEEKDIELLLGDAVIDGGDVLPGFSLAVSDVFAK